MANFTLRYYKQALIIPVVGVATLLTSFISHFVNTNWGIALSAFALAGGLFTVIDLWLWWLWPIKYLYHLKDFRGRYNGTITYERRDERGVLHTGTLKHEKVITQTGSGVVVRSITYKSDGSISSESMSHVESIELERDGSFKLIYSYLNEGNVKLGFPPHYGTEVLVFTTESRVKQLKGHYYTNRLPVQTRGEVNVIFNKSINKKENGKL